MSNASYRYSYALFSLAKEEDKLDEIFEDFSAFIKAYEEDSNIKKVFSMLSKGEKKDIVKKIASENKIFANFLFILIDKDRFDLVKLMYLDFKKMYYSEKNILQAEVVTKIPLDEQTKQKLLSKLKEKYNKDLILIETVDENILGGIILYVDTEVIDLSVKQKLNDLRKRLYETKIVWGKRYEFKTRRD